MRHEPSEECCDDRPTQALATYDELSAFLQLPRGTLYSLVSRGEIPHIRLGKRIVRFRWSEILAWVDERRLSVSLGVSRAENRYSPDDTDPTLGEEEAGES